MFIGKVVDVVPLREFPFGVDVYVVETSIGNIVRESLSSPKVGLRVNFNGDWITVPFGFLNKTSKELLDNGEKVDKVRLNIHDIKFQRTNNHKTNILYVSGMAKSEETPNLVYSFTIDNENRMFMDIFEVDDIEAVRKLNKLFEGL